MRTGQRIDSKSWDKKKQVAKRSYIGSPELNTLLNSLRENIKSRHRLLAAEKSVINFEDIKSIVSDCIDGANAIPTTDTKTNKKAELDSPKSFYEVFEIYLNLNADDLGEATVKKYKALRNLVQAFDSTQRKPSQSRGSKLTRVSKRSPLRIDQFDLLTYDRFKKYLLTEKGHINNTVFKYTGLLKAFLRWSMRRKYHQNDDFLEFKCSKDKTDFVYLTEEELFALYSFDFKSVDWKVDEEDVRLHTKFSKQKISSADEKRAVIEKIVERKAGKLKTYEAVRDAFCFTCFCGQRFSDLSNLQRSDIRGDTWFLRTKKTRDPLQVPFNPFALEILDKYVEDDRPIPVISAQKTNKYLKEIWKMAGIDEAFTRIRYKGSKRIEESGPKYEFVGTHTARRTFIILSLEKGMRVETLMEITGHKDYRSLAPYVKIVSKVKHQEMNQVWSRENFDAN